MSKRNYAKTLGDFFNLRLNSELISWFNEWWEDFEDNEIIAEYPPGLIYKSTSYYRMMHPDTLPIASLGNGDQFSLRFDHQGYLIECGIWEHETPRWLALDKSLIESVIFYYFSILTSENLMIMREQQKQTTDQEIPSVKRCALDIAREFASNAEQLCLKEPKLAAIVLSRHLQESTRRSSASFRKLLTGFTEDFLKSAQGLLSPDIDSKFARSFSQWLVDAISENKSEKKLRSQFIKLADEIDFPKIVQSVTLTHSNSQSRIEKFLEAANFLIGDEPDIRLQTIKEELEYKTELLKEIKSFWKKLDQDNPNLPSLKTLSALKGSEPLRLLADHNIAKPAVINEFINLLNDHDADLSEELDTGIHDLIGSEQYSLKFLLTQEPRQVDSHKLNEALGELAQRVENCEWLVSDHLQHFEQITPYQPILSEEILQNPLIAAMLNENPQQKVHDFWLEKAQQAEKDNDYKSCYQFLYRAGWDCQNPDNGSKVIDQLIDVADTGGYTCWRNLARWHKQVS